MYEIAKMLKLKFKFMFGWKGIDRSIYEISVFYSFRLFNYRDPAEGWHRS